MLWLTIVLPVPPSTPLASISTNSNLLNMTTTLLFSNYFYSIFIQPSLDFLEVGIGSQWSIILNYIFLGSLVLAIGRC